MIRSQHQNQGQFLFPSYEFCYNSDSSIFSITNPTAVQDALKGWVAYLQKCKHITTVLKYISSISMTLVCAPQRPFCTSSWWGGMNSQVGECLVGLCHQG